MLDLSQIKHEKLRNLMEKSIYFANLSLDEQAKYLGHIAKLDSDKMESLCDFFEDQNAMADENLQKKLKAIYEQVLDLKNKLQKLIAADPEKMERQIEDKQLDALINDLEKN